MAQPNTPKPKPKPKPKLKQKPACTRPHLTASSLSGLTRSTWMKRACMRGKRRRSRLRGGPIGGGLGWGGYKVVGLCIELAAMGISEGGHKGVYPSVPPSLHPSTWAPCFPARRYQGLGQQHASRLVLGDLQCSHVEAREALRTRFPRRHLARPAGSTHLLQRGRHQRDEQSGQDEHENEDVACPQQARRDMVRHPSVEQREVGVACERLRGRGLQTAAMGSGVPPERLLPSHPRPLPLPPEGPLLQLPCMPPSTALTCHPRQHRHGGSEEPIKLLQVSTGKRGTTAAAEFE